MARTGDDFIADFKKLQKKIALTAAARGEKLKRELQAALKTAWDKEDALRAAIKTAKAGGVEGDKPADFRKDKTYAPALAAWEAAVAIYRGKVDDMKKFAQDASATADALKKILEPAEKDNKKAKSTDKKMAAALKEAGAAQAGLKKSLGIYGTLKAHEVFYASRLKASIEGIHKEIAKKPGKDGELAKLIQETTLRKNAANAGKMQDAIAHLCEMARDGEGGDARKAAKSLSLAQDRLKDLSKLNDKYQTAKTKLKKAISASKTKGFTLKQIATIEKAYGAAKDMIAATTKEMA